MGGRAGRKRKTGRRHPGGELVRDKRPDDKVRAGRQPHRRRLEDTDRLSDRGESPFGQLSLMRNRAGKTIISENQYQAGEHFAVLVGQYRSVIGAPASTAGSGRALGCDAEHCLAVRFRELCPCEERRIRYHRAYEALATIGRRELMAVNRVAVHREAIAREDLVYLKAGLDGLAKHFGLGIRRSREYSGNAH